MNAAVEINGLTKLYGAKKALDNIKLNVANGGCFGLLGPNGAGKSTLMKLLTGILEPDSGTIKMLGSDSKSNKDDIIRKTGYVPQDITLFETLSARRNLIFFGEMYGLKGSELKKRVDEVLEQVGLADRAKDRLGSFSGGMKRRINIAASLLHDPELIILDEPTVGIDPQSRNHIFEMIRSLKESGKTILYSTHYMEEAETLCDDIAIMDGGRVIAEGALGDVLAKHATSAVYIEAEGLSAPPLVAGVSSALPDGRGWLLETDEPLEVIGRLAGTMGESRMSVRSLELMKPTLESVFLKLTGSTLRDE